MHADGETAAAGVQVIARERPLAALVEFALRIQRKRVGRNDRTATEDVEHVLTRRLLDGSIGHP
jgi:hypothetical protein